MQQSSAQEPRIPNKQQADPDVVFSEMFALRLGMASGRTLVCLKTVVHYSKFLSHASRPRPSKTQQDSTIVMIASDKRSLRVVISFVIVV